jgi:hypothetical protein
MGDTFRHNKEIIPLYLKLKDTRDDRSLVLLSSLIIEFLIDKLLNTILPDYKRIQENREAHSEFKQVLKKRSGIKRGLNIMQCVMSLNFAQDFLKVSQTNFDIADLAGASLTIASLGLLIVDDG